MPKIEVFSLTSNWNNYIDYDIYVRASQRSALVLRSFTSHDPKPLTKAYCTYVRAIIEYGSSIWSPVYQSDIYNYIYNYIYEFIHKHFTKRLYGLSDFNYIERLKRLDIDTLEKRRLYCDLTLCYKMIYSHQTLVFTDYFIINNAKTRNNNNYKFKEQPSKVNIRSNFFYQSSHTGLKLTSRGDSYCSEFEFF